jgi:hypothetical protein
MTLDAAEPIGFRGAVSVKETIPVHHSVTPGMLIGACIVIRLKLSSAVDFCDVQRGSRPAMWEVSFFDLRGRP